MSVLHDLNSLNNFYWVRFSFYTFFIEISCFIQQFSALSVFLCISQKCLLKAFCFDFLALQIFVLFMLCFGLVSYDYNAISCCSFQDVGAAKQIATFISLRASISWFSEYGTKLRKGRATLLSAISRFTSAWRLLIWSWAAIPFVRFVRYIPGT